jgi:hypothetical protein
MPRPKGSKNKTAVDEQSRRIDLLDLKEEMRLKFLEEHPNFDNTRKNIALPEVPVTPLNASEVLVGAMNRVIGIYNDIAASITSDDIKKMKPNEKILALQKLSYLHGATKKMKPTSVKFLQINTNNKSAGELESALLELNRDEEEQDNAQG